MNNKPMKRIIELQPTEYDALQRIISVAKNDDYLDDIFMIQVGCVGFGPDPDRECIVIEDATFVRQKTFHTM